MLEIYNGRDKFYQWDVGQRLIVDDTIIAVHYDNGTGDALVCGVYEYEGQYVADVPNIMLQTVWAIKCYAYCGECVRAEKVYEVEKRSRPDDYIYTETETLRYSSLLEMINATNDDLATVEQSLEASIAENADNIAAVNYGFLEYKEETNKKIYDNTVKLVGVESDLEIHVDNIYESLNEHKAKLNQQDNRMSAIEQKHNAEIEDVENQIGKTNTQYATLYNTVNTNANSLTNLTQNYYAFKNDSTAKLTNHENRITTLEKSGGSGTGGGGVNATPDWNENNPDSPAYIANRTHYENPNEVVEILAESSPDEIAEDDGMMIGMYANPIGLEVGKKYRVKWNGVEYECVAVSMLDIQPDAGLPAVVIGNYGVMMGGDDTGEPFIIMDMPPDWVEDMGAGTILYLLDGSTELTLSIDAYGSIKKIDKKYLDLSEYAKTENVNELSERLDNYYNKDYIDSMLNPGLPRMAQVKMMDKADSGEISVSGRKRLWINFNASSQGTENIIVKVIDNNNAIVVQAEIEEAIVYGKGGNVDISVYFANDYKYVIADIENYKSTSTYAVAELKRTRHTYSSYDNTRTFQKVQITTASGNPITAATAQIFVYGRTD